jgi:hypothetical protein
VSQKRGKIEIRRPETKNLVIEGDFFAMVTLIPTKACTKLERSRKCLGRKEESRQREQLGQGLGVI